MNAAKLKVCKQCKAEYQPRKPLQTVCSLTCALDRSREGRREAARKDQRRRDTETRARLKTLSARRKEAQAAFNEYVRMRDFNKPCVSCGQSPYQGQRHASHYRSRGAASHLAFNLYNVHASCAQCNSSKSGNIIPYRVELIRRIGQERVEALENDNQTRRFSHDYLNRMKKIMRKKARMIRKRKGI